MRIVVRRDFRPGPQRHSKVRDLDEAIRVANETDYALTAGFFSRSPANIERAKAEMVAAMFTSIVPAPARSLAVILSADSRCRGGGTKAGGADYLLQFIVPRVVTENIMRHGFAPESTPQYRDEFLPRR